jgi:nitrous oxidase accessory protein NosD
MRPTRSSALASAAAIATALAAAGLAAGGPTAAAAAAQPRSGAALYVNTAGKSTNADTSCSSAKYNNINTAIAHSSKGMTIYVCGGTYAEDVVVDKQVTVKGLGTPTINATGMDNGITVRWSGSTVWGFKVQGAIGEGILAVRVGGVTISNNTVVHDDNGTSTSTYSECKANGNVPGDCGEGIHLMTVVNSVVSDNTVMFNLGGILVSDEFGPTAHNTITGNTVEDNEVDCGITVVGHNPGAVKNGVPQPSKAGVYDNLITDNIVISNGTIGEGGGVLLAAGAPNSGSYDNTVTGNEIAGNGLSGVTVHLHIPGSDVSGDVIKNNWIGTNDLTGDPGTGDSRTTGVLVDNGGTKQPIKITIQDNTIAWDFFGIYDDSGVLPTLGGNTYLHVRVNVQT